MNFLLRSLLTLEFKSTLQWDIVQHRVNKDLRHSVLKTIAAFLNSNGGTLVIGVEDDGHIIGLENDLKQHSGSLDQFEQLLSSLIAEFIGPQYTIFIDTRFEIIEGQRVCLVEIDKSQEPAFLKSVRGREFHVRVGNTTRALDIAESVSYIDMNWDL